MNLPVPGITPVHHAERPVLPGGHRPHRPAGRPDQLELRIHGMVAREVVITFDQLLHRPLIEDYITLCCVSNPVDGPYIGNAKWLGASLASLIRAAGPLRGAEQLLCTSVDGFTSGVPLVDGARRRPGLAGRGGDERDRAADRARVPGPAGGTRPVRVRVGLQVGGRHRGDDVGGAAGLLGAARLVAAGPDQDRVADRRPGLRLPGEGGQDLGRRGGVGAAQGHRGGRGPGGQRALARGDAGGRARPRHLAAVGLGVGRDRPARTRSRRARPTRRGTPRRRSRSRRRPTAPAATRSPRSTSPSRAVASARAAARPGRPRSG